MKSNLLLTTTFNGRSVDIYDTPFKASGGAFIYKTSLIPHKPPTVLKSFTCGNLDCSECPLYTSDDNCRTLLFEALENQPEFQALKITHPEYFI